MCLIGFLILASDVMEFFTGYVSIQNMKGVEYRRHVEPIPGIFSE